MYLMQEALKDPPHLLYSQVSLQCEFSQVSEGMWKKERFSNTDDIK